MAKALVMTFLNAGGKKVSIKLNSVKDTLTDADVTPVMDTIIAKNIFSSTGGDLKTRESAQLTDSTVQKFTVK